MKLLGSDKERQLYEPQEYFWRKLGQDSASSGVSFDLYFFPNAYIDIASVGALSALTGGETNLYMSFDANRDSEKFINDFQRALSRRFGYDAVMRIRVSNGNLDYSFL